jgi:branched-chain amino acid transport system permease protein
MAVAIATLLNGISYGMVLFLIASGLSLTLGLMGIVNLAHGVVFVLGGFAGLFVARATESFLLAILAGALASGVAGLIIERGFLRYLYKQTLPQVLVTFGFIYIITNLMLWVCGPQPRSAFVPSYFSGSVVIAGVSFPLHRFAIIGIGVVICALLWWLQEKTKIGAIVRAGMDNAEMVGGLGINLTPVNIGAFFIGSALAGASCIIGAQLFGSVGFGDGMDMLLIAVAVVIVGGVGSVQGALVGALLIGIIDTFGRVYFPVISQYTMYLVLILVLVVRPSGLLGRKL